MKETVLRALFMWLLMTIMIQPTLSHADYLRDLVVKNNANYLSQKAAAEGTVTPALRDEVIQNLIAVGFPADEIEIIYESSIFDRKQTMDIIITAPRYNLWVYAFGSLAGPSQYYARATIMSEYLE